MNKNLPVPTKYIGDLALMQFRERNANSAPFIKWLLNYWHLVHPSVREHLVSTIQYEHNRTGNDQGVWYQVIDRQRKPVPLDFGLHQEPKEGDIVGWARYLAVWAHDGAGQLYSDKPYSSHLEPVADTARAYVHLLQPAYHAIVEAGAWTHDYIEDGHGTFNDLAKRIGRPAATISQLLVSSPGETRKERHDTAYHERVASSELSTYDKLCDRLRNITGGEDTPKGMSMKRQYREEQPHFEEVLNVRGRYPHLLPLLDDIHVALGLEKSAA